MDRMCDKTSTKHEQFPRQLLEKNKYLGPGKLTFQP